MDKRLFFRFLSALVLTVIFSIPCKAQAEPVTTYYSKQEVYITMRDGVKLFTSIYTPKDNKEKHPILITRTPYDIEPGGPGQYSISMSSPYIRDNYIRVFQDVRGRYMSEGKFEDIRPYIPVKKSASTTDESTDTWDTVDWLIKNVPGNNGNVGIFGTSYPGFYSTMGIIGAHPAVKAVSPQAPVTAWFIGDDWHHNGAFFLADCFNFYSGAGFDTKFPTRSRYPRFIYPTPDNYDFFLSIGAIRNISPKYLGDSSRFWKQAFSHPDYDEFWKARDPRQYLRNVTPAVMTTGGWFDAEDLYGALHLYEAIEKQNSPSVNNTIVMGPWSHGQWNGEEAYNLGNISWGFNVNTAYRELEKNFFDHYLRGMNTPGIPEAFIFVTGKNEWQSFKTWPPANTTIEKLFLGDSGKIALSAEGIKNFDEYISDPFKPVPYADEIHTNRTTKYMTDDQRFAARRPDVIVYKTGILDKDITIAGPVTADLFVSTTGTDADFIVKLIDVFPDSIRSPDTEEYTVPPGGYQMLVRGEVFRGKYRNSFEKPEPFVPGEVTEVKYQLPDVAHTFKKGHRIMIQVQSSWFPLTDRNPQKFVNIYECSESDFMKATHRIYHDPQFPSSVEIRVLGDN